MKVKRKIIKTLKIYTMKIYGSNEYVNIEDQTEEWLQLEVINQWDFKSTPVCYQLVLNSNIRYSLHKNTPDSTHTYKYEEIQVLNDEMRECLIEMGYTLSH